MNYEMDRAPRLRTRTTARALSRLHVEPCRFISTRRAISRIEVLLTERISGGRASFPIARSLGRSGRALVPRMNLTRPRTFTLRSFEFQMPGSKIAVGQRRKNFGESSLCARLHRGEWMTRARCTSGYLRSYLSLYFISISLDYRK